MIKKKVAAGLICVSF